MSTLGAAIKESRETSGLSRAALANLAGVSHVFIGKIEQGARRPSPATLARIASALRISAADLKTRAALLEASNATNNDERQKKLLKAVSASTALHSGAAALAISSSIPGGFIALSLAAKYAESSRASQNKKSAREQLLSLIGKLTEDEAAIILAAITNAQEGEQR